MPKKILLADDSVTIQKVVELTFAEGDYEVTSVSNGRAALEKLKESRPDIMLCDIIMPEVSGYEVAEFVKRSPLYSAIPVILLTGTFEPFDEEKARLSGADTYITKPFDSRMLVEKVEGLLKKRLVLEDLGPTAMEVVSEQGRTMTVGGDAPMSTPSAVPEAPFFAADSEPPPAPASPAVAEAFAPMAEPAAFAPAEFAPFEASGSPFEAAAPPSPAIPAPEPVSFEAPAAAAALAAPFAPPVPEPPAAPLTTHEEVAPEPEVEDLSSLVPAASPAVAFGSLVEPPQQEPVYKVTAPAAPQEVSLPAATSTFDEEPLTEEAVVPPTEEPGAEDWGQTETASALAAEPPLPPFAESEGPDPEVESTPWSDVPSEAVEPAEGIIHEMTDQQEMVSAAHSFEGAALPAAPAEEPEDVTATVEHAFPAPTEKPPAPAAERVYEAPAAERVYEAPAAERVYEAPAAAAVAGVTAEQVEAIVRRVVAEMAPELVRQVAWEVIPELAESVIKRRIQELETQVE